MGIQIFLTRFKIKYHPSIFEKYREHDLNAVGVYKEFSEDSSFALVGHLPVELSRLVACFLGTAKMNSISVQVCRNGSYSSWTLSSKNEEE